MLADAGPLAGGGIAVGAYRLQAEIARCHVQPQTDWVRVATLYELLGRPCPRRWCG